MARDGCRGGCLASGLLAIVVFFLVAAIGLAIVAGTSWSALFDSDPCVAYRREVAIRDRAIETNAGKQRLLNSGWLTMEEYEEQLVPIPPEPEEPAGGC